MNHFACVRRCGILVRSTSRSSRRSGQRKNQQLSHQRQSHIRSRALRRRLYRASLCEARRSRTNRVTSLTERQLHSRRARQWQEDHVANGRQVHSDTGPPGRMLVLKLSDRESQKLGVPAALLNFVDVDRRVIAGPQCERKTADNQLHCVACIGRERHLIA